jgi:hypothetical protein
MTCASDPAWPCQLPPEGSLHAGRATPSAGRVCLAAHKHQKRQISACARRSQHAGLMRQACAHEAILLMEPEADERAPRCGRRGGVGRARGPRAAVSLAATPRARRPGCQRPARQGCVRGRARNGASGTAAHRTGLVRTVAVPGRLRHPVAAPGKLAQRGVTGRDRSAERLMRSQPALRAPGMAGIWSPAGWSVRWVPGRGGQLTGLLAAVRARHPDPRPLTV